MKELYFFCYPFFISIHFYITFVTFNCRMLIIKIIIGRFKRMFAGLFLLLIGLAMDVKAEKVRLFTPNDGLSNSHINHIYQDSKGYIWIATENGLNKFNGYDFEALLSIPGDSTSLRGNYISCVYEDSRGLFWVSTSYGLLQYDRNRDIFFPWKTGNSDESYEERRAGCIMEDRNHNLWISFPGNGVVRIDANTFLPAIFNKQNSWLNDDNISVIFEDKDGNIWFGSEDYGITFLNTQNNTVSYYEHHPDDPSSLSANKIFAICEDAAGSIWIGTIGGGILIFDKKSQSFQSLKTEDSSMKNMIFSLLLDHQQNVWVGTDGAGIYKYDVWRNKTQYWEEASLICDLRNAKIHALFQDKQGNIWVAVHQKGVLFISSSGNYFQNIGFNPFDASKSIGTHCVISIIEDHQGYVWVGTDGDGLYRIHPSGNTEHFTSSNTTGFYGNAITALFEDRDHDIWIGTYTSGFFRYHQKTGKFDSHFLKTDSENSLSYNYVSAFTQNDNGEIWIGTNGGGISLFHPETHYFKQYLFYADQEKNQLSSNWVFHILIDRDKQVWVATSNGLDLYNPEEDKFETFSLSGDSRIISNLMYALHEDYKGNIWIGSDYGLRRLEKTTGKSRLITTNNGLPDNMITGIEEDNNHALWISTGNGLCRYDHDIEDIVIFYAEDGIQSNEFRRGSHFKGKNDKMYFGGINGITTFYPSRFADESPLLGLVFTDLFVNNVPVSVGQSDILKNSIDETTSIRMKYHQRNFAIHFAALEFAMPNRVEYYTQMENFDSNWRQIKNHNRSVTYTNLNPGIYVFRVKATIDGINVLQKDLKIMIMSPLWWSTLAKLIYLALLVLVLYGIYIYLSYRQLEKYHAKLEQVVEQRTRELSLAKEKAEESDKLKSSFLANMSHEIRTPLNGIVGFVQFINSDKLTPERRQEYIKVINNSSKQLVRIIDDIIDVSKIEAKQMTFTPFPVHLNELMNELLVFFKTSLHSQNKERVSLILDDSGFIDHCIIFTDAFRLRQILNNLISNAVKFTEKGFIRFGYRKSEHGLLEFFVEDTGIGLRSDQKEVIFERFRQAELGDARRFYSGTGLGLTISRSLVQMGGGKMWVESTEGNGSIFYFTFAYIPVASEDLQIFDLKIRPSTDEKPFSEKSILFVENNFLKFNYYAKLISETGAQVVRAESLNEWNNTMLIYQINIIFVDSTLLENESVDSIRYLFKECNKFPIVLIVSEKKEKYMQLLQQNLCCAVICEPVNYAEFSGIIEKYMI